MSGGRMSGGRMSGGRLSGGLMSGGLMSAHREGLWYFLEWRLAPQICMSGCLTTNCRRKRASKRQLQSLLGKLTWSSAVIRGGRVFLRRIINAIAVLKRPSHKTRLNDEIRADLHWWQNCMQTFNGKAFLLETTPYSAVYTDACNIGAGAFWRDNWLYCYWELDCASAAEMHINEKELLTVVLAAARWSELWQNQRIYVLSDNMVTVARVNRYTSCNPFIMMCLRYLFWLSVNFNFQLRAIHIKGKHNDKADMLSRLHEPHVFRDMLRSMPYCDVSIWATTAMGRNGNGLN